MVLGHCLAHNVKILGLRKFHVYSVNKGFISNHEITDRSIIFYNFHIRSQVPSCYIVFVGAFELIADESKAGSCLWITNRRGMEYWPTPAEEAKYLVRRSSLRKRAVVEAAFNFQLPESFEKL